MTEAGKDQSPSFLYNKIDSRVSIWHFVITSIVIGFSALTLAMLYGFGPGLMPSAGMHQFFLGLARCYAEHLPALRCDAVGQPAGYITVFGLPYVMPVAILDRMGLPLLFAGRLVELFYLVLAFVGCAGLIRSFGVRWVIVLTASFLFFASPIVYAQDGYGPLRLGFALLPFYAWIDRVLARRVIAAKTGNELFTIGAVALIIFSAVRCIALFMDGYSFVMGLVLSVAVLMPLVLNSVGRFELSKRFLVGVIIVLSTLLAYFLYTAYAGETVERTVMPIDFFRGQGVDVYALLVPSVLQWFSQWFELHHSLTGWMTYSDGPNVTHVYLGGSLLVLFLVGLFILFFRRMGAERKAQLAVLMVLALGSLLLALGPSLKVADFRMDPQPDRAIRFSDYLMPASEATLNLPTERLYQEAPGIRNMRAVYRWMLLVKLSFLLIAAIVLDQLFNRSANSPLMLLILLLIVIELLPDVPQRFEHGQRQFTQYKAFERDALSSLIDLNLKDRKVLLLPADPAAGWNHFAANFLCPMAELRCFNLGGDKSLLQARLTWPIELRELSRGRWVVGNLQALMSSQAMDEILIPLFSLRSAAEWWPPAPDSIEHHLDQALALAQKMGAEGTRRGWFFQLSSADSSLDRSTVAEQPITVIDVDRWGPVAGSFDEGFNVQPDGRSSFWVLFAEGSSPDERMILSLDCFDLETYNDSKVLSGRLPNASDRERFPPGKYPLAVRDRVTGDITLLGEFTVVQP